jgi:hypothetical protein
MKVRDRRLEEDTTKKAQYRVTEPSVQKWHGAWLDGAPEPRPHDQIGSISQRLDHRDRLTKVVTLVGITHDQQSPSGDGQTAHQSAAVSASVDVDNTDPVLEGNGLRSIGTPVVGDYNLRIEVIRLDTRPRSLDTGSQGVSLVEAGHHERDLDPLLGHVFLNSKIIVQNSPP